MAFGRIFRLRFLITTFVLCSIIGVALFGVLWARATLPIMDGEVAVTGLRSSVSLYRDRLGVAYIYADNAEDSYAALGYAHAQDRLWQMEAMRRLVNGRLAEILGARALPSDRFMRLMGFHRLVREQFNGLKPTTQRALEFYAKGVNSWMASQRQALPPEFALLAFAPEPWRPEDSLLWGRLMALRLSGNWRDELVRTKMLENLSDQQVLSFWYPDITPFKIADSNKSNQFPDTDVASTLSEALLNLFPSAPSTPAGASNAWVVAGSRADSGKPILANDPHLGFALPGTWYLAHIETPAFVRSGATIPGVPFTILGHNSAVAWGATSTQSDQQDIFIEKVSPDGRTYLNENGAYVPFETRRESISVYGRADEIMTVRKTVHGPVISDLIGSVEAVVGDNTALSLSAIFLSANDSTPDALMDMNAARDWRSFETALKQFQSPQMNIVYADVGGTIGFMAPGLVPIRRTGRGRFPVPGWNAAYAWNGSVPMDKLPRSVNPPEGTIVSANNAIVSDEYPYFISDDWAPSYRATRIFQLLGALSPVSVANMGDIQRDSVSEMARELLPAMTAFVPRNPRAAEAISRLSRWDGTMSKNGVEPLVFYAWLRELNRALYADEVGTLFDQVFGLRPKFVLRALRNENQWCDDVSTVQPETCTEILEGALVRALAQLKTMGPDGRPVHRWGEVHQSTFRHQLFTELPLLSSAWGHLKVPADGGNYTINRAAIRAADANEPFADIHGPGFRAIYDLGNLSQSQFVIATGQSGIALSEHYADMLPIWSAGRYVQLNAGANDLTSQGFSQLRLNPSTSGKPTIEPLDRMTPYLDTAMQSVAKFMRNAVTVFSGGVD